MKLSKRAFQALWDVHAWIGITAGLLLYVICFTGAFAVYFDELGVWQEPALRRPATTSTVRYDAVDALLQSQRINTTIVDVFLPDEHRSAIEVRHRRGVSRERVYVHPETGELIEERSRLAVILFYLHFLYHERFFPQGIVLTGLLGAAMMLGLLTGFVLHFRNLISHFHQFRPASGRAAWPDAHKVLAVFGLPFQLMAAFTGVMICFGPMMLRLAVGPVFHGDAKTAERAIFGAFSGPRPSGEKAPPLELARLIDSAEAAVPGIRPTALRFHAYGDAAGTVTVYGKHDSSPVALVSARLRLKDGTVVHTEPPNAMRPGQTIERWVRSLHFGELGGWPMKVAYALSALAACLTILTGNWLWILRRLSQGRTRGTRVLSCSTLAIGGGSCLATASLFCANLLVPSSFDGKKLVEAWAFFGVWGLSCVWSFARRNARACWAEMLTVSGVLFASVPLLDALTRDIHLLNVGRHGVWIVAGIDLGLFLFGVALLAAARRVRSAEKAATAKSEGILRHA